MSWLLNHRNQIPKYATSIEKQVIEWWKVIFGGCLIKGDIFLVNFLIYCEFWIFLMRYFLGTLLNLKTAIINFLEHEKLLEGSSASVMGIASDSSSSRNFSGDRGPLWVGLQRGHRNPGDYASGGSRRCQRFSENKWKIKILRKIFYYC